MKEIIVSQSMVVATWIARVVLKRRCAMSSASHCEIERDLGNPYSVELATGVFGFGTKKKVSKTEKWVARAGQGAAQPGSSGDAASDGHSSWLAEAHSDIQKQKHEADQKHTQEQAEMAKKHAQIHENIKHKAAALEQAKVLDVQHRRAMDQHAKMEAEKKKALDHHDMQVKDAHEKSTAASKAAEDAKNAFLGTSHHNAQASSDTGHDSSHWDYVNNHENMYSDLHAPQIRSQEISREINDAEKKGAFGIGRHQVRLSNSTRGPKPPPRPSLWRGR